MEVTLDKEFEISLLGYSTAGYIWITEFDDNYFNLEDTAIKPPSKNKEGGASLTIFTFIPIKIGTSNIIMLQKRPWEQTEIKKKIFNIVIKE